LESIIFYLNNFFNLDMLMDESNGIPIFAPLFKYILFNFLLSFFAKS